MEPMLQNKIPKLQVPVALQQSKNSVFAIIALLIAGFMFYKFLLSPKLKEVSVRETDLAAVLEEKAGVEGDVKALKDLSLKLNQNPRDINRLDQALPLTERQLRTQLLMEQLVSSSGLVIGDLTVSSQTDQVVAGNLAYLNNPYGAKRALGVISVSMSVNGSFDQMLGLIQKLENYGRIMDISSIDLSGPGSDPGIDPLLASQLSMRLLLNTYYYGAE